MLCNNTQHFFFFFSLPLARAAADASKSSAAKKASCVLQQQILAEPLSTTAINCRVYQSLSFTLQDVTCSFSQLHHRHHFLKSFIVVFSPSSFPRPVCPGAEEQGVAVLPAGRRPPPPTGLLGLCPHQLPRQLHAGVLPQEHHLGRPDLQHPLRPQELALRPGSRPRLAS